MRVPVGASPLAGAWTPVCINVDPCLHSETPGHVTAVSKAEGTLDDCMGEGEEGLVMRKPYFIRSCAMSRM